MPYTEMKAYHGKQERKSAILLQLKQHRLADELVKGQYWENGTGLAMVRPAIERTKP